MSLRIRRKAEARWNGTVEKGSGRILLGSGVLDAPYSLRSRVDDDPQTNPEELIGAAHAGCFAMSLANLLTERGHPPRSIDATATVQLEHEPTGFSITRIELAVTGDVPALEGEAFVALAEEAKRTCPVSRALAGTQITLVAALRTPELDPIPQGL